jgi:AraC-like DNA-binding protein
LIAFREPHAVIRNILIIEGIVAQVLGLILVAALLSARPRSTANRLLAVGLFCVVLRQFLIMMKVSGAFWSFPLLFRLSFPFQLLAIPAFYLYVVALTTPDFKLERKHAVHLIPSAMGFAWYFAVLAWGSPSLLEPGPSYERELYARYVIKALVVIPYLVFGRRQILAFEREVKNHVSDVAHLRLKWLRTLLVVAYAAGTVDVLEVATGRQIAVWHLVPSVGAIFFVVLAYFSLRVSRVLAWECQCGKAESLPDFTVPQQNIELNGDAHKGRLPDEELARQKERLIRVLQNQALYLNPELRLSDLAAALGLRPYRVSEILNRGLQTSFYDLINGYRIARAQELLSSQSSAHLNLLGIAMESGFRSKSVFNEVFKKMTGKTPSEFRIRNMTESADPAGRIARSGR